MDALTSSSSGGYCVWVLVGGSYGAWVSDIIGGGTRVCLRDLGGCLVLQWVYMLLEGFVLGLAPMGIC